MTHNNRKIIITLDGEKGHSGTRTVEIIENGKPKTRFEWTEATFTSLALMEIATDILCACHEDMMKHWMKYNHVPDPGEMVEQEHIADASKMMEQAEVDIVKEYDEQFYSDPVYRKLANRYAGIAIARHFYELGRNAGKEK